MPAAPHLLSSGTTHRLARRRWAMALVVGVTGLTVLAGCGSSSGSSSSSSSPAAPSSSSSSSGSSSPSAAASATITISSYQYTVPTSVAPGATITVDNKDTVNHTVTSDKSGMFNDNAGANASSTFKAPTTPGKYTFHCTYHSNMHGTLIVK